MSDFVPDIVYLDSQAKGYDLTEYVLRRLSSVPTQEIEDVAEFLETFRTRPHPVSRGKRSLLLTRQRGPFIKPCPCTPAYLGCNYTVINTDTQCPMDCSYCILQLYLDNPIVTVHVNTMDLEKELDRVLDKRSDFLRIGTGELGDSLALDGLTARSRRLIRYFRLRPKAVFELKTKTDNIEHILEEKPPENVIIAWSLNSCVVADKDERGAPPVIARLRAAQLVCRHGYRTAFHFDPVVHYQGWREGYREVCDLLFQHVPPDSVAWISVGSLRYPSDLKAIIRDRHPKSLLTYEEMVRGRDGKQRYYRSIREEMYRELLKALKDASGGRLPPIYFCMEDQEMWEEIFKKKPRDKEAVERLLLLSRG